MEKHWKILEHKINREKLPRKLLSVIVGNFFTTLSIVTILRPNQLISGGVNGISVLVEYVTGIPLSVLVILLNLPLLIAGLIFLDREFIFYTILSTILSSFYIFMMDKYLPDTMYLTHDIVLSAFFGGALSGLGGGITFRNGTSTGGFDILAAILKKHFNIQVGRVLLLLNGVIIGFSAYIFSIDRALYTLVAFVINYNLVDKIQLGVGKQKELIIISRKNQEIANMIMEKINRGVTFIDAQGAYFKTEYRIVYCICSAFELVRIKNLTRAIDPESFITVCDTSEIEGRGFKNIEI